MLFNAELTTVTVPPALIAPPSVGAPPLGVIATFPVNVDPSTRTLPGVFIAAPPDSETAFNTCVDFRTTSGVTVVRLSPGTVVEDTWIATPEVAKLPEASCGFASLARD